MTTDTAVEKNIQTPTEGRPANQLSLRRRFERVKSHVDRATFNAQSLQERRMQRNAAFVAADSLMSELDPIIQANKKDPLTELNTKKTFEDILDVAAAKAKVDKSTLMLLYIDLDGFKAVNDTLGHDVGDEVLKEIGAIINNNIRPGDVAARLEEQQDLDEPQVNGEAARLGGDEFAALLLNTDEQGAKRVIERLREKSASIPVNERLSKSGLAIGMSAGIRPVDLDDPRKSLREADQAMYEEKRLRKEAKALAA